MKIEYYGKVEDGKLPASFWKDFQNGLNTLNGKYIVVGLEQRKKKRSLEQNAYFHGVMVPCVREMLYSAGFTCLTNEQAKSTIKTLFLEWEEELNGIVVKHTKDTRELTTSEFSDLIASVQVWAIETFDYVIPSPGEQLTIDETTTKD